MTGDRLDVVAVYWSDAWVQYNYGEEDDEVHVMMPLMTVTIGIVLGIDRVAVRVVDEVTAHGDLGNVTVIPRGMVRSIKRLGKVRHARVR